MGLAIRGGLCFVHAPKDVDDETLMARGPFSCAFAVETAPPPVDFEPAVVDRGQLEEGDHRRRARDAEGDSPRSRENQLWREHNEGKTKTSQRTMHGR